MSCRDWEWNATGWMPWFGVVTERIAAMAWSEASISSVIGRSGIQWQRIGAEENASFRRLKADFFCRPETPGDRFLTKVCEWLGDF